MALNSRWAGAAGGQHAGTMDREGRAGAVHSSSPPIWGLVQSVPTISVLRDVICVSSWDAAGGRPCHSICHPARLTGSGWCLQSQVPEGINFVVGELQGAVEWRPRLKCLSSCLD